MLCFLLACIHTCGLAAPLITVNDAAQHFNISHQMDLLGNPSNLSLETLYQQGQFNQFLPANKARLIEYVNQSNYLAIRFGIHNTSNHTQTWWIHNNNSDIKELQAFSQNINGEFLALPAAAIEDSSTIKSIKEIRIPAHAQQVFFLTLALKNGITPSLELDTPKKFIQEYVDQHNQFTIIATALVLIGLINLLLVFYRSNVIFFYHSCLIFSILATIIVAFLPITWFEHVNEWQNKAVVVLTLISTNSSIFCLKQYIKNQRNAEQQRILHPLYHLLKNALYLNVLLHCVIFIFANQYNILTFLPILMIAVLLPAAFLYSYFIYKDRTALAITVTSISASILCFMPLILNDTSNASITVFSRPLTWGLFVCHSFIITILFYLNDNKYLMESLKRQQITSKKIIERSAQIDLLKKISGEIQTPLSDISGASDLLLNGLALSEEQETHCTIIRNSAIQLVHKIADIDYDIKLEEDTSPIRTSPFELIPRLERWVKKISSDAQQKNNEIIIDINNDVPYTVKGDEYRLRQILMHLLNSAILRTEQGQIILKVWKSEVDKKIVFNLEDTGIAPSVELTFPYTKKPNSPHTQSPEEKANFLLQTLSSSLETTISTQSNIMEFRLALPAINNIDAKNNNNDCLKNKRLLIVDDNKISLDVLKRQLTHWGIKCTSADDSQKAISFYRNNNNLNIPFEAIILDYDMPQVNGLELAQKITQEATEHKPIIIMLVGTNQSPSERLIRSVGVDFIVDKPVSQTLLHTLLCNTFQKNNPLHKTQQDYQKIRVLVVDDDDTIRFVISKMLDSFGMTHTLVNSGRKACDLCIRESFDIILMDCQMPDMDGFETAIAIHKHQQDQHQPLTPVIALTAYTLNEYKQKSQTAGMSSYLEKPIDKNELLAALQKHQS